MIQTWLTVALVLVNAWGSVDVADSKVGMSSAFPSLAQHARREKGREGWRADFEAKYSLQTLDHFSFTPESYTVFNQKLLINRRFWRRGSPIIVYTGNEGNIEWFAENSGFSLVLARKFQAMLVFIEHRFYGDSRPSGNNSRDLGYLNSQQALADYAVLVRSLKRNISCPTCPVVVFGGSYGGSTSPFPWINYVIFLLRSSIFPTRFSCCFSVLAAWFRLKYPHIAIGALASSAPILHFDNIIPRTSFYDAVSQDFKEVSPNSYEVIKGSWEELDTMWAKEDGMEKLSAAFRSCRKLQHSKSASDWLRSAFTYTSMVNYPTKANFMRSLPAFPVKEMCQVIDSFPAGTSKLSKTIAAASIYYNYSGSEHCFDIESSGDPHGLSGWGWQACTEMVMPMSCGSNCMLPSYSYDFHESVEYCEKKFGVLPRPHWITTEFGGDRIDRVLKKFGSNIIFSNGLQDPWSRGGVLRNISSTIIALVAEEGVHHTDLLAPTKDDPDWLVDQRKQEMNIIGEWLRDFYSTMKET